MSNSSGVVFELPSQEHVDMLYELLSKAAAPGPAAQVLADLFAAAKKCKSGS